MTGSGPCLPASRIAGSRGLAGVRAICGCVPEAMTLSAAGCPRASGNRSVSRTSTVGRIRSVSVLSRRNAAGSSSATTAAGSPPEGSSTTMTQPSANRAIAPNVPIMQFAGEWKAEPSIPNRPAAGRADSGRVQIIRRHDPVIPGPIRGSRRPRAATLEPLSHQLGTAALGSGGNRLFTSIPRKRSSA